MRVTGGSIEYGEQRKIAEYENKKANVVLTFNIEEGSDPAAAEAFVDNITKGAIEHVHNMLGIAKKAPAATGGKPTASAKAPESLTEAVQEVVEEAPTPPKKRGPNKKKQDAAPEEPVAEEEIEPDAPAEDLEPDAPAVSDQDLVLAISKKNTVLNDAGKIKKLIAKFGERSSAIPQAMRPTFLQELTSL